MVQAGGLIRLHFHDNIDVLDKFKYKDGVLYYDGIPLQANAKPLYQSIDISKKANNILTSNSDGLFVDGSLLNRFSYDTTTKELKFDNVVISMDEDDTKVSDETEKLWATDPYTALSLNATTLESDETTIPWNTGGNTQSNTGTSGSNASGGSVGTGG